jgi:WD40 repeat protein
MKAYLWVGHTNLSLFPPCYTHKMVNGVLLFVYTTVVCIILQAVTCVAVSPDNAYFATGDKDCLVRLFDLGSGKEVRFFRGHFDCVSDVCFVTSSVLASTSYDATISLWDVELGHR